MTAPETARDIQDQAADWAVRLEAGLSGDDHAHLEAWLAQDRRRQGALLRAQAGLALLSGPSGVETVSPRSAPRPDRRRVFAGVAAAAAAMGALLLIPILSRTRYRTDVGEIRRVPLEDGSLAAINTDTELDIAFEPRTRSVRLEKGEAWFQVAKNPERPFVVTVGAVKVVAVGTAFSVRRRPMGVEVLVTEGLVEVSGGQVGPGTRVPAGSQIFVSDAGQPARALHRPLEMDRALAWREGQIVLDGDTVAAAVGEFNRYNTRKIVITDPRLEGRRVVGWFHTNEPDSFARAVALSEQATVSASGEVILLGG